MKFFTAFFYIIGTVLLGISAFSGLTLSAVVDPSNEYYRGYIAGLLPTATAIFGMTSFNLGKKWLELSKEFG